VEFAARTIPAAPVTGVTLFTPGARVARNVLRRVLFHRGRSSSAVTTTIRLPEIGSQCGKGGALRREGGFTLAEFAIVLALLALLVGAIVLGRGLVEQSRMRALVNDFDGLGAAVSLYTERYGALPGDDPQAETRWAGRARNGTGDLRISGAYEAPPPAGDPLSALTVDATGGESLNFWWHLRLAGLVVAPPRSVTQVAQPLNYYFGVVGVEWGVLGFPGLTLCTSNLPGDAAIAMDLRLDDGNPRQGRVRAARQTSDNQPIGTADAAVTAFSAADRYILCQRID
jgi:hypothetical protein